MTTILIIEGNTPDLVASGRGAADGFVRTFTTLSPETRIRIVNPYVQPIRDADLHGADGVVFTGAGVGWSVDADEGTPQRAAMEVALASGRPIWGSCNGLQLAMWVLGGAVGASSCGIEIGMALNMVLTASGAAHPMMTGRVQSFAAPCVHRDEVQALPDGTALLAGNDHSYVQAAAYERDGVRFWGTQYHPELSPRDIGAYVRGGGIFSDHSDLVNDLIAAEADIAAAERLGTHPDALVLPERSRELANWLQFITKG